MPGLDADRTYRVRRLELGPPPRTVQDAGPAWLEAGAIELTGRVLAEVGLAVPLLAPENALLLELTAV
jgi:alpha-galactosidase